MWDNIRQLLLVRKVLHLNLHHLLHFLHPLLLNSLLLLLRSMISSDSAFYLFAPFCLRVSLPFFLLNPPYITINRLLAGWFFWHVVDDRGGGGFKTAEEERGGVASDQFNQSRFDLLRSSPCHYLDRLMIMICKRDLSPLLWSCRRRHLVARGLQTFITLSSSVSGRERGGGGGGADCFKSRVKRQSGRQSDRESHSRKWVRAFSLRVIGLQSPPPPPSPLGFSSRSNDLFWLQIEKNFQL